MTSFLLCWPRLPKTAHLFPLEGIFLAAAAFLAMIFAPIAHHWPGHIEVLGPLQANMDLTLISLEAARSVLEGEPKAFGPHARALFKCVALASIGVIDHCLRRTVYREVVRQAPFLALALIPIRPRHPCQKHRYFPRHVTWKSSIPTPRSCSHVPHPAKER